MKKRLLTIIIIVLSLLSIPLIAMQFTEEVKWDEIDFLVAGFLLFMLGLLIDTLIRSKDRIKIVFIIAGMLSVALIWGHLAVGIF